MQKTRYRKILLAGLVGTVLLSGCGRQVTPQSTDIENQTRRPTIALALGGGASKGFAHVGVIKVLEQNHIPIDVVTGTSAGAFVGSLYAYGLSANQLEQEAMGIKKTDIVDLKLSTNGFIRGDKIQKFVNQKVRNTPIQHFVKKFAAVATRFSTGEMVAFNYGNAGQAVRASVSIPNVFQPTVISGQRYVDGGLVAPVPVSAAKNMGADIVIAVDISAKPNQIKQNGFFDYLDQSLNIMGITALKRELEKADVVIRPDVLKMGAVGGFEDRKKAILEGERATLAVLPKIQAIIEQYQTSGSTQISN